MRQMVCPKQEIQILLGGCNLTYTGPGYPAEFVIGQLTFDLGLYPGRTVVLEADYTAVVTAPEYVRCYDVTGGGATEITANGPSMFTLGTWMSVAQFHIETAPIIVGGPGTGQMLAAARQYEWRVAFPNATSDTIRMGSCGIRILRG